jgi:hypothetical protein
MAVDVCRDLNPGGQALNATACNADQQGKALESGTSFGSRGLPHLPNAHRAHPDAVVAGLPDGMIACPKKYKKIF